jgi:hypothetical protein
MRYSSFRKLVQRFEQAICALDGHAASDSFETTYGLFPDLLECTQGRIRRLLTFFESEPGTALEPWGPVLHPEDTRVAASIELPLVLCFDSTFPTVVNGSLGALEDISEALLVAIEVYDGWKQYSVGCYPTKWQGFPRQVPDTAFAGLALLAPDDRYLAKLFKNLQESVSRGRESVESYFGCSVEEL